MSKKEIGGSDERKNIMPADLLALVQALGSFGAAGANIFVVIIFLRYMEKRDKAATKCAEALSSIAQEAAVSRDRR